MKGRVVLLMMLVATALVAQTAEGEAEKVVDGGAKSGTGVNLNLKLGIETGYSRNSLNTSTGYRAFTAYSDRGGFLIGVPVLVSFNEQFALGSGLRYVQKNYTYERDFLEGTHIYADYTNDFLQVPVYADFSVGYKDLRMFFDLGATFGAWLRSNRKGVWIGLPVNPYAPDYLPLENFNENIDFDNTRDRRFEAALFAGVGFRYALKHFTPFVSAQFHYGLTDLQKDYMINQVARYNNTVTIQIGVLLGGLR
jgi:hypothetical protein